MTTEKFLLSISASSIFAKAKAVQEVCDELVFHQG
jgi:hypothetical protein